jgi:hypothetical protein
MPVVNGDATATVEVVYSEFSQRHEDHTVSHENLDHSEKRTSSGSKQMVNNEAVREPNISSSFKETRF